MKKPFVLISAAATLILLIGAAALLMGYIHTPPQARAAQTFDDLLTKQSHEQSEGQAKTKGLAPQRRNLAISNLHNDVVCAVENRLQHNECRKYHVLTLRHFEPSSFFNKRKKLQGLIEEP